jgi:hypothetical protein
VKIVAATGREKPLKARKPMSGFGMKKGRKGMSGVMRQEVEKA